MLDVGCGIGHFYEFMNSAGLIKKLKIEYSGIDLSKKLVDFARVIFIWMRAVG